MALFAKKGLFEDTKQVEDLRTRLVEMLNEHYWTKIAIGNINGKGNHIMERVVGQEHIMKTYYPNFKVKPESEVIPTDGSYLGGLRCFNDLEKAREELKQWESEDLPRKEKFEAEKQRLEEEIQALKEELSCYVAVEIKEIDMPVWDERGKRYR